MFDNLEALDSDKHKDLRFTQAGDFGFAAGLASAPLSASEVVAASKCFPVVFSTEGPLLPLAMLSVKEGVNSFVDGAGKWLAPYVPAHVRRYPFILGNTDTPDNYTIMFVPGAPHFADSAGEALFTADGQRGPTLNKAVDFLTALQQEIVATEKLLAPLVETGVLTVQRLELTDFDGKTASIEGVRAVDREKLTALDDTTLAGWVRDGMMNVIDAHLASLGNFVALTARQGTEPPASAEAGTTGNKPWGRPNA